MIQQGLVVGGTNMKYNLTINQHNIKPHLEIEQSIQQRRNGLFTLNLRVNQGNIEDFSKYRTKTYAEYRSIIFTTFQEPDPTRNTGNGGSEPAIRPDKR